MSDAKQPTVLFLVRFKSALPREEVEERYRARLPEFRKVDGLLQKYYLHDPETDEWGGLYLFESQAALDAFMVSELRRTIPEAYQIVGPPRIEVVPIVDSL